jgi:D-tyrosyl-tRNA(Tyr) deacylase
MRILLQRVGHASVKVDGRQVASIRKGYLVLVGIGSGDAPEQARKLAEKLLGLRLFADEAGKMNLNLAQVGGSLLLVSQFTLFADTKKGNRPSFVDAARPEHARPLFDYFVAYCRSLAPNTDIQTGVFGAMMDVELCNDGPVTIWMDSAQWD